MFGLDKTRRIIIGSAAVLVAAVVAVFVSVSLVGSGSSAAAPSKGPWRALPEAPFSIDAGLTSVWTGRELIVSGLTGAAADGNLLDAVEATAAYNPTTQAWRRLAAPPGSPSYCRRGAVWTGSEMLIWGCDQLAYNPRTDTWRQLPTAPTREGIVVWTGREMIGWGGGCCGDVDAGGSAYRPATNTWRTLAPAPLSPEQRPAGAWTGRELVLFAGRTGAAYNPRTDSWRRIAAAPARLRGAGTTWDGNEIFFFTGAHVFAYNPRNNHWRALPATEARETAPVPVWDGYRVLAWGPTGEGLAYGPHSNRWSTLPQAPLQARSDQAVAWTGHELIVWGGSHSTDGAAFVPREAGDRAMPLSRNRSAAPLPQCC